MDNKKERLGDLFLKYQAGTQTVAERQLMLALLLDPGNAELAKSLIGNEMDKVAGVNFSLNDHRAEEIIHEILSADNQPGYIAPLKIMHARWLKYAAAIVGIFAIGAYLYISTGKKNQNIQFVQQVSVNKPVIPGSNKATLTLSSGKVITLDNASSGELVTEGNSSVIKTNDGQIIYSSINENSGNNNVHVNAAPLINTMRTPNGGQYRLRLSDGTKVWLNAASSITYPAVFAGNNRTVQVSGEAYFEVARNTHSPFIVESSGENITVLGTRFNVHAYTDDIFKTSLLEGSVKLNNNILQPGQAYTNGKVIPARVDDDISWIHGLFNFSSVPFQEAMRYIARWYDVDIKYDNGIPKAELKGKMDRNLMLQEALAGLEGSSFHFRLEGRTIHVIAKN